MKFFPLSIPSSIGNVLGDIAATLPARTWVYVAQLDSCQETFEICGRLVPVGQQESLRRIGQHCALPLSVLDDEDVRNALFVGFDEVYFSLEGISQPQARPIIAFLPDHRADRVGRGFRTVAGAERVSIGTWRWLRSEHPRRLPHHQPRSPRGASSRLRQLRLVGVRAVLGSWREIALSHEGRGDIGQ